MSCRIASVTSYLSEKNDARNPQNGDLHLAQIADIGMGYLENYFVYDVDDS